MSAPASTRPPHIVTDSYARFTLPEELTGAPLTILPNQLALGEERLREHAGQPAASLLRRLRENAAPAQLLPPASEDYARLFTQLGMTQPAVLSIHASEQISPTIAHARQAAAALHGHCEIALLDSQNISVMQGLLVEAAVAGARQGVSLERLLPALRGMTGRIYSVFLVEELEALRDSGYLSAAHTILSQMHDFRIVVSVEDGALRLIEKARSRAAGIERLVEYVLEFEELEACYILQAQPGHTETTRILRERMALERPGLAFGQMLYGAALATLIGTEATGIALLERGLTLDEAGGAA